VERNFKASQSPQKIVASVEDEGEEEEEEERGQRKRIEKLEREV
jgi:hypothetical protein